MPLRDTSYQHWDGVHLNVWGRRMVIARNGLNSCLEVKGMRQLVWMGWVAALGMTAILFLVGQLLVADSMVVQWVANLNPDLQAFAETLTTWLVQHPEISVHTTQNILFYYACVYLMRFSIFLLAIVMPLLITRDLASNAIIIYSSKAVSRGDYLLGKFATVVGLLLLTWLGPLCAAWFVGNLLGPDWRFFWHARAALFHILLYGLSTMSILGGLALGVSAISSKEKATGGFWMMWWIVGFVLVPIATRTKPWLRHLSFNFDLDQIALAIFRPGNDVEIAQENIPILGDMLGNISPETMMRLNNPSTWGAVLALLLMLVIAATVIGKRVKAE